MKARPEQEEVAGDFETVREHINDTRKFIADALVSHETKPSESPFTKSGRRAHVRHDLVQALNTLSLAEFFSHGLQRQIVYGWATATEGSAEEAAAARAKAGIPPLEPKPDTPAANPKRTQAIAEIEGSTGNALRSVEKAMRDLAYAIHCLRDDGEAMDASEALGAVTKAVGWLAEIQSAVEHCAEQGVTLAGAS